MKIKFSIIVPLYRNFEIIDLLTSKIIEEIIKINSSYEIIYIDDNSPDQTWIKLKKLRNKNKKIKISKNNVNIGQHNSIYKGIKYSKGKYIFILDGDLQDNPRYFKKFFRSIKNTDGAVVGLMSSGSYQKKYISILFWIVLNLFSKYRFPFNLTNYTLLTSKNAKKLPKIKMPGFLYGDICRLNIKVKFIQIKRNKRFFGKSSYTLKKKLDDTIKWLYIYIFN